MSAAGSSGRGSAGRCAALFALVAVAVVPGCRRSKSIPTYEELMPASAHAVPKTERQYRLVETIEVGMRELRGIATDGEDRLYVVGPGGVHILDADRRELKTWPVPDDARAIAVAGDGTVFVVVAAKVLKFDRDGKGLGSWGVEGSAPGELRGVTSIAVSGENVFVADWKNLCVHRFDTTGDFINDIGRRNDEADFMGLVVPSPYLDVVVDGEGKVIVANPGRRRVETYTMNGRLLGYWGESGVRPERFCGCCNPTNLALTPDGLIVTSEKGLPRVKVYDRTGKMLAYIPPSVFPADAKGMGLAVDSKGRIYVAEPVKGRIMVFALQESEEGR